MSWGPTLTSEQQDTLDQQVDIDLPAAIQTYQVGKAQVEAMHAELLKIVSLHEAFWYWYHDDVASKYEDELKWIDGHFITDPVIGADLDEARQFIDCRLFPADYVELNPLYIDQLKGVTNETTPEYGCEQCHHPVAYELAQALDNGQSGTGDTTTTSDVDPSTTNISVSSTTGFGAGDRAVIQVGGSIAVFRIDSVSGTLNGAIIAFCGASPITSGATISSKQADQDSAMDSELITIITALNNQKTALQNNKDDISYTGVATDIAGATTNINTTIGNYTTWSTYSDLVGYMAARATFVGTRVGQVSVAVDTATIGIYDRRYRWLNNLINHSTGTYILLDGAAASIDFFNASIAYLQSQIDDMEEWRSG